MFFTEYNLSNPGDFTCCIAVPPESLGEHLVTLPCQKALCIFYHGAYEGLPVIVKHLCAYANKYQIPLKAPPATSIWRDRPSTKILRIF